MYFFSFIFFSFLFFTFLFHLFPLLPKSLHQLRNLILPVHLETWNFALSFLSVYTFHYWHSNSSKLHSAIKNVLQDSLEEALETQCSVENVIFQCTQSKGGKPTQIFTFRCTTSQPILSHAERTDHETVHLGAGNCRVKCCVMWDRSRWPLKVNILTQDVIETLSKLAERA